MTQNYTDIINSRAEHVFDVMAQRVSPQDVERLRAAFELAKEAHAKQKRKTGEPYILHPIAVATIAAEELMLGTNPVMAAFLHDVVEDTPYTIEDIRQRFGDDVAFLVKVVTKSAKPNYEFSKQVDNYRQMLNSLQYDVRALLVKLADRLHNMRTLSSMRPDKQMKIAGETDYFYAPLANRLGLYNIKIELENLSMQFRCPHEYAKLVSLIARDEEAQRDRLKAFTDKISSVLNEAGIDADVFVEYRKPYSIWRKMRKYGDDFNHLKYRHFTEIIFKTPEGMTEMEMTLKIYAVLSSHFSEKPGGISNYIDNPKENGYQSFHVKLLADFGRWQEVHISSARMVRNSQLGCVAERTESNIDRWIEKFKSVLKDIASQGQDGGSFIEDVVTSFYNDDIMTFTPKGRAIRLPQQATALDFAFELHTELGLHAKYVRINGFLATIDTKLRRGDVVEIFTDEQCVPEPEWLQYVHTYKATKSIFRYLSSLPKPKYNRCESCCPIPGEEVFGFKEADGSITIHKRDCETAISLASQFGDNLVSVDFESDDTLYPMFIEVVAVDRYHLFVDLVETITNQLKLSMDSFNTSTVHSIVTCQIRLGVHSFDELQSIISHISAIAGVDTVTYRTIYSAPF